MSERLMPRPLFIGSEGNVPLCTYVGDTSRFDYRSGDARRLGAFVLPPFQRPFVWTDEQCVKFIESLWLGLPISQFVVNEDFQEPYTYDGWLLDGQQRWTAIYRYEASEFPVFGHYYRELGEVEVRKFGNLCFPCIRVASRDKGWLKEIHDRLAYGGTAHV